MILNAMILYPIQLITCMLGPRVLQRRFPKFSPLVLGIVLITWFGFTLGAHVLARTHLPGWSLAEGFAHQGVWWSFGWMGFMGLAYLEGVDQTGKAQCSRFALVGLYLICGGLLLVKTIPVYYFLPRESIREPGGYRLQHSSATCGPVALGNLYELLTGNQAPSERTLARWAGTTLDGTTNRGLLKAARKVGLPLQVLPPGHQLTPSDLPVMIEISTLPEVNHATLLLTMNEDSVLLLDPDYGFQPASRTWLTRVQKGKILRPDVRADSPMHVPAPDNP